MKSGTSVLQAFLHVLGGGSESNCLQVVESPLLAVVVARFPLGIPTNAEILDKLGEDAAMTPSIPVDRDTMVGGVTLLYEGFGRHRIVVDGLGDKAGQRNDAAAQSDWSVWRDF